MNVNEVRILLDRFYEGTATESEERQLRTFFSAGQVPEELRGEQALFEAFHAQEAPLPSGFEQRMERQVDSWNMLEKSSTRRARTAVLRWISGIAASVAVLFSVVWMVNSVSDSKEYAVQQETYDNPQDAYAETQRALKLFSAKMNKGLAKISNNNQQHQ
ncbi:MAG TPA: hypothetical protein VIQ97_03895 [Prevotella sp.]